MIYFFDVIDICNMVKGYIMDRELYSLEFALYSNLQRYNLIMHMICDTFIKHKSVLISELYNCKNMNYSSLIFFTIFNKHSYTSMQQLIDTRRRKSIRLRGYKSMVRLPKT